MKNNVKKTVYFKDWSLLSLDKKFSLKQVYNNVTLEQWLSYAKTIALTALEQAMIEHWRNYLSQNVHDWNEQELSRYFIGTLFSLVLFTTEKFNLFAQRHLSAVIQNIELTGKPDGLIASGKRAPELPFFCLSEFKREQESSGDPAGQALAAMLVAQTQNQAVLGEQKIPVYGCYVSGKAWYFMVLEEKEYAISEVYIATKKDVFDIVKILKGLKILLLKQAEEISR